VSTPVEATAPTKSGFSATAAFFDLDEALIARSSTLAFGPSFYRHGLLSRAEMMRGALAQLRYRVIGADHRHMEKLKAHALQACRGWPADG
jgi:phosphoserine phosphatase